MDINYMDVNFNSGIVLNIVVWTFNSLKNYTWYRNPYNRNSILRQDQK